MAVVFAFVALHLGLFFLMDLGLFPWVCIVMWLTLLPSAFWDFVESRFKVKKANAELFYDGDCAFCRRGTLTISQLLGLEHLSLRPGQSDPLVFKAMEQHHSWILRSGGEIVARSEVFWRLLALSPYFAILRHLRKLPGAPFVLERVYSFVSSKRKYFSLLFPNRFSALKASLPPKFFYLVPIVLTCFAWNIDSLPRQSFYLPRVFKDLGHLLRLEQNWKLFAPFPSTDGGEFRIIGVREDGSEFDAFRGAAIVEQPSNVSATYGNPKWRKYLTNLWFKKNSRYRPALAQYFCRKNEKEKPREIRLVYLLWQIKTLEKVPSAQARPEPMGKYRCR